MSAGKNTPGPWEATFDTTAKGLPSWRIDSDSRALMASLVYSPDPDDPECAAEIEANARLIAAAPDLAEALLALLPILDNDGPLPRAYADAGEIARAALQKAGRA